MRIVCISQVQNCKAMLNIYGNLVLTAISHLNNNITSNKISHKDFPILTCRLLAPCSSPLLSTIHTSTSLGDIGRWEKKNRVVYPPQQPGEPRRPAVRTCLNLFFMNCQAVEWTIYLIDTPPFPFWCKCLRQIRKLFIYVQSIIIVQTQNKALKHWI